jgi:hypothetical protein
VTSVAEWDEELPIYLRLGSPRRQTVVAADKLAKSIARSEIRKTKYKTGGRKCTLKFFSLMTMHRSAVRLFDAGREE